MSDEDDAELERLLETTDEPLPPEEPLPSELDDDEDLIIEHDDLLDRMRGVGVGTEDPNIVGDAGPVDIPPGADPHE
jgi:hypothetical protein